jgi:hypothetical protein
MVESSDIEKSGVEEPTVSICKRKTGQEAAEAE